MYHKGISAKNKDNKESTRDNNSRATAIDEQLHALYEQSGLIGLDLHALVCFFGFSEHLTSRGTVYRLVAFRSS